MALSRRTKWLLFTPLVILVLPVLLAVVLSYFYSDQIKELILKQLNRQLKTEIKVGDFGFTLLGHFPFASFEMKEVLVYEPYRKTNADTLLYSKKISLLFNLSGLFSDDVNIKRIVVQNGTAHIKIDSKGNPNYEIWEKDTTGKNAVVNLSKVVLQQVAISYADQKHKQQYAIEAKDVELNGQFAAETFNLAIKGDLFVQQFKSGTVDYITQKPVELSTALFVNTKTSDYRLDQSEIKIAQLLFKVSGNFNTFSDTRMDLQIASGKADLDEFISLLPQQYLVYLEKFNAEGEFVFNAGIKGTVSEKTNPAITASFSINKGSLEPKGKSIALEEINFSGTLKTQSLPGKESVEIRNMTAKLGPSLIKADFRITDFSKPDLEAHASSKLQLSDVGQFLSLDTLESLEGTADINISVSGHLKDMDGLDSSIAQSIHSSGSIILENASFKLKQNPLEFTSISAKLLLNGDQVSVDALDGFISSTDIHLKGELNDFFSFLFTRDHIAAIQASLSSSRLNLDELLINNATTTRQDTAYKLKVNPRIVADLEVRIGELQFRKFRAGNLNGRIHLEDQVISGRGLSFESMEGVVRMDAAINVSRRDSVMTSCDATIAKLDINQLFNQLENFNQDVLTEKNVKGLVSASVQYKASLSKDLTFNPATVKATCDVTIENGELNNFSPIMSLSKYLKLKDLSNIKFSTLHNVISIADRQLIIPQMEIKSSALNLSGSGTHTFDNIIDYKVKLLLSDVLGKKIKRDSEFGEIEDDGLGHTQLFLTMKGPVDNPKISLDKKAVVDKIKSDIVREKNTLKELIRQEFGGAKKDSTRHRELEKKKKEEMQIEW